MEKEQNIVFFFVFFSRNRKNKNRCLFFASIRFSLKMVLLVLPHICSILLSVFICLSVSLAAIAHCNSGGQWHGGGGNGDDGSD